MVSPAWFPRLGGNIHLESLRALFGRLRVGPDEVPRYESIIVICFTNRCGSNYLASGLASTGAVNKAHEIFNAEHPADYPGQRTFPSFLRAALQDQQLGERLAIKVGVPHLEILGEAGLLDLWRDNIRYVFIERADRLAQAVSWEIAVQSGSWHSGIDPQGREPVYDRSRIEEAINYFAELNRNFDVFFGMNGIQPTNVLYEELSARPNDVVARVASDLGFPQTTLHPERVRFTRQADRRNEEWRARFLEGR